MGGVAERIEYRGDLIVDGRRQLEHVASRDGQVFGESAGAIHAHARRVAAQMAPPRAAIAAMAAGDVPLARHPVAGLEAAHFAAHLDDLTRIFVAHGHGHRHRLLRPRVPVVDVHVGAADGGTVHLDEYVVVAHRGFRNVLHPDTGFGPCLDERFHWNP